MSIVFPWAADEFGALLATCEVDDVTPHLLEHLPRRGVIVEAGCGLGRYVKYLADRGYDIVGVELGGEALRCAKQEAPEIRLIQGDVLRMPFPTNSIAGIVSLGVIEHFSDGCDAPLREIYPAAVATCHSVPAAGIQTVRRIQRERHLPLPTNAIPLWRLLDRLFRVNLGGRSHSLVIAVSAKVAEELATWYGRPSRRIRVVPTAVDLERFSPLHRQIWRSEIRQALGISERACVFLFVGNGYTVKGLDYALEAMRRVAGTDSVLVVAGEGGSETGRFEARAHSLGLDGRVRFVGPQREIWKYFSAADVFVLPSLYEAAPLVVLEALASGVPVLASREAGFAGELLDGSNGFAVSRCDAVDELAMRMQELAGQPTVRKRLGEEARRTAQSFSWERMLDCTRRVYAEVATGGATR